ncbi:MAG: hypothetical protein CL424_13020 [Acidimicrobiaceae bacterium]|nr:hypothetical protein [Acidimicrobiaceae bacterium]
MDYEYSQRRRTFIAIAITLVLGPAAFLLTRGDDDNSAQPEITVIGTTPPSGSDATVAPTAPTATDVMGTSPVEVLSGDGPGSADDPATIAIPRPPQGVTGVATFSREISDVADCVVGAVGVPFEAVVTVTNLDNSMQIDCINNVGGARPEEAVVLHADAFLQIADLTDAPVPVRITW